MEKFYACCLFLIGSIIGITNLYYIYLFSTSSETVSGCYNIQAWVNVIIILASCCCQGKCSNGTPATIIINFFVLWISKLWIWFIVSNENQCGPYEGNTFLIMTYWLYSFFFIVSNIALMIESPIFSAAGLIVFIFWYTISFFINVWSASTCYQILACFNILAIYINLCFQNLQTKTIYILFHLYLVAAWGCQLWVWFMLNEDSQCGSLKGSGFLEVTYWLHKFLILLLTGTKIYLYFQPSPLDLQRNLNLAILRDRAQSQAYRRGNYNYNTGLTQNQIASIPKVSYTYSEFSSQPTCVICYSEFTPGSWVSQLPQCKHIFHSECISGWLQKNKTCPSDRTPIQIYQLQQGYRPPIV